MASFGISNKFAVLQVQQPQQPKPKGEKLVNSVAPSVNKSEEKEKSKNEVSNNSNNNNNNNNNRRGGDNRRGGNRGNRGGNRGGANRGVDRYTTDKTRDPDQPPRRNKRIYDRNSNVPKNDVKKSGSGQGNWGSEKDVPRGIDDAKKELTEEEQQQQQAANGEQKSEGEQPQNIVEAEPEDKTITLKQYQELLAEKAPKFEKNLRTAGEGEKSDLHKYTVLKKDDEEDLGLPIVIKAKKEKKKQAKKVTTIALEVPANNNNNNNNNDDRRRGNKYNNNNNRRQQKKVNLAIEDTASFPALK